MNRKPRKDYSSGSLVFRLCAAAVFICSVGGGPTALAEDKGVPVTAVEAAHTKNVDQLARPQDLLKFYPSFEVTPRIPVLENGNYPCTDCHNEDQPANPKIRELEEEHTDISLKHGAGQYWCLTCHNKDNRDVLTSLKGMPISFDESFLLCGQCHFQRQKDFYLGGHGKRVGNWQGEKTLTPCTECHNPHSPAFKQRKPYPEPKARRGLEANVRRTFHHEMPWESVEERHEKANRNHPSNDKPHTGTGESKE